MLVMMKPPSVGPATVATPATAPHIPIAAPRLAGGNMTLMTARVCGVSIAPPTPWMTRPAISWLVSWARPQRAEAIVNTARPATNRLRWP